MLHSRPARLVSNPLVAWASFFAVLWMAHLTGLYEAALRSDGVHALEHVVFLVTALVFWAPIVRADPSPSVLSYPAKILYLFVAMPAMALLGLAIESAREVLYPTYAQAEGVGRALADQRCGRRDHVGWHDGPDRAGARHRALGVDGGRRTRGPQGRCPTCARRGDRSDQGGTG